MAGNSGFISKDSRKHLSVNSHPPVVVSPNMYQLTEKKSQNGAKFVPQSSGTRVSNSQTTSSDHPKVPDYLILHHDEGGDCNKNTYLAVVSNADDQINININSHKSGNNKNLTPKTFPIKNNLEFSKEFEAESQNMAPVNEDPIASVLGINDFDISFNDHLTRFDANDSLIDIEGSYSKMPPLAVSEHLIEIKPTIGTNGENINNLIFRNRKFSNEPRVCMKCGRRFKYPSDLKKHEQIHTEVKKYLCPNCGRSFRRLHQLNVHLRIHTGEKPYVCNQCGMSFRHDSTLTMHTRTRHDHLKPFSCDVCGKSFGRLSHLRKHQKYVCASSRKNNRDLDDNDAISNPIYPPYMCHDCGGLFSDENLFIKHEASCSRKIISQEITPQEPPNRRFIINSNKSSIPPMNSSCNICDLTCAQPLELQQHLDTAHRNHYLNSQIMNQPSDTLTTNLQDFHEIYHSNVNNPHHLNNYDYSSIFETTNTFLNQDFDTNNNSKLEFEITPTYINSSNTNETRKSTAEIESLLDETNYNIK